MVRQLLVPLCRTAAHDCFVRHSTTHEGKHISISQFTHFLYSSVRGKPVSKQWCSGTMQVCKWLSKTKASPSIRGSVGACE